jgi:MFS superfamily sulfate permease-like transporter
MYRLGFDQFIPFIATVAGILLTDLLKGIAIGIAFAIFYILRTNYRHSYHYKREDNGEGEVVSLRLSEEVTFLNKARIQLTLDALPRNSKVIIDGSNSVDIDYDVLEIINEFKLHRAPSKNISVVTINIDEVETMGH